MKVEEVTIDILLSNGVLTVLKCEARITTRWGSRHGKGKSQDNESRELHIRCKRRFVEMSQKVSDKR